jgi:hypothetical protein
MKPQVTDNVSGPDGRRYLVSTIRYEQKGSEELWETAVFEGVGFTTSEENQRYSMWAFNPHMAEATHRDVVRRVRNEPAESWAVTPEFIATIRLSAIASFQEATTPASGPPKVITEYTTNLMRLAERDMNRLDACWRGLGLALDWQQRLSALYEFTLFYLQVTDRYMAEYAPKVRDLVVSGITSIAWLSYLSRSVAEPLPEDLESDPAIKENWIGFQQDVQLRRLAYGTARWAQASDPVNTPGTLLWEFGRLVARAFDRPDDEAAIRCVVSAMDGTMAELGIAQLIPRG